MTDPVDYKEKFYALVNAFNNRIGDLDKMMAQNLKAKKYCWDDPEGKAELSGEITGHSIEKYFILNTLKNFGEG